MSRTHQYQKAPPKNSSIFQDSDCYSTVTERIPVWLPGRLFDNFEQASSYDGSTKVRNAPYSSVDPGMVGGYKINTPIEEIRRQRLAKFLKGSADQACDVQKYFDTTRPTIHEIRSPLNLNQVG